jgi:hypothetical protein
LTTTQKIPLKYTIPKQYPWPAKARGPFSKQLLANKDTIQQASNFMIATLLFQSRFLDLAVLLSLESPEVTVPLLDFISNLVPSLKRYDSPFSAFAPLVIDCLLRVLYQNPVGFNL